MTFNLLPQYRYQSPQGTETLFPAMFALFLYYSPSPYYQKHLFRRVHSVSLSFAYRYFLTDFQL